MAAQVLKPEEYFITEQPYYEAIGNEIEVFEAALDTDGDGTYDCHDDCPDDPAKTAAGECGCGVADTDSDGDGTADCNDDCPDDPAKTVPGDCGCGVADTDGDGDGVPGGVYNFWFRAVLPQFTKYVDKAAPDGGDGSDTQPFNRISTALASAGL